MDCAPEKLRLPGEACSSVVDADIVSDTPCSSTPPNSLDTELPIVVFGMGTGRYDVLMYVTKVWITPVMMLLVRGSVVPDCD